MQHERTEDLDFVEKRLAVLQQLAAELDRGIEAVTAMDGDALDAHARRQEQFCAALRLLNGQMREQPAVSGEPRGANVPKALLGPESLDATRQRQALQRETALAETLVRRRNRVYAGLLERSRQSVQTMMNVMVGFAATYEPHKTGPVFG